jgi:teichuronic acid biosynthesis glycosyltransferase TuaC
MRILAITQCYPHPGHSGHCVSQSHQIRALARGNDVRLVVPVPWRGRLLHQRPIDEEQCWNGDRLRICFPISWYPPKILRSYYGQFYLASIRKAVRRMVEDFNPEIIFACWAHPDGWAAVRIARHLGVPAVIKVIGSDVLVLGRRGRRRQVLAQTLRAADGVVAVSRDLAQHVIELGVDARKVHVVPEGIDVDLFSPGDQLAARAALGVPVDAKMLLFVGNLLLSKGAGVLIEACAKLASAGVRFSCYLVGRGRDESKLRAIANAQGVADRVIFAGPCHQQALANWYRASDVVTLPSFSEGIPNVLREALQCERPFVATRVGGIPEISDPAVSQLVNPGDAAELAQALEAMLASPPQVNETIPARFNIPWSRSAEMVADLLQRTATTDCGLPANGVTEMAIQ